MPIPKPDEKENEKEFVARCMGDDVMVKDYSNTRQRAAICYDSWRKSKRENMERVAGLLKSLKKKNEVK